MPPFEIEADPGRPILRVYFRGVVTSRILEDSAERSDASIARMKPGFTVVVDLSDLERMDLDCVPQITRLMDLFRHAGVGRVCRVIPDRSKDIGFTVLSHTRYRGQVPFSTVTSIAEAETELAGQI
jgi:hypothetical protein